MRHVSYLFLLSLLLPGQLFAQSILRGQVVDQASGQFLAFAQLRLLQKGEGIITNEEGRFALKLPLGTETDTLLISYVGYQTASLPLSSLDDDRELRIPLFSAGVTLDSVWIRPVTAEELLRQALAAVEDNYRFEPLNGEAFYRELIRENGKYVEISEAVLSVYKTPSGLEPGPGSQVSLVKGRHRTTPQKLQNLIVSSGAGHPQNLMAMQVNCRPKSYHFLETKNFKLYEYQIEGTTLYQDREVWIIGFDQAKKLRKKLYQGKIYLDVGTMAFALIEYDISERGKKYRMSQVMSVFERGKLALAAALGYKFRLTGDQGRMAFLYEQGHWYPSHVSQRGQAYTTAPERETAAEVYFDWAAQLIYTDWAFGRQARAIAPTERMHADQHMKDLVGEYDASFWESYQHLELSSELQEVFNQPLPQESTQIED
ncbi:MAG: carboxypeptidase-like regulatory domain-containing protein [Bacteroidota bacterium]